MLRPLLLLPLLCLSVTAHAPPFPAPVAPRAAITSIVNALTTYTANQTVHIWRGEAAQMEVWGAVVGTALGVDILLADGTTPAPLMVGSIVTRKPSSAVIKIDVAALVTRATYVVRFRYPVAVGDPDQFKVRVYDRGSITSLAASNTSPKVGETITITATGQNLERARLDLSQVGQSPSSYSVASRSATSMSFTIKFGGVGLTSIGSHQFLDEDIGGSMGTLTAQYTGNSTRTLEILPNPVITSVSPAATVGIGTVTISGSGLNPTGWTPKIRVDDLTASNPELAVTVVNGSTLRFESGMTPNYRDLHLRYRRNDGAGSLVEVPLPHQVLAQLPPKIQRAGDVLVGSGPADCGAMPPCPSGTDTRVFGLKAGATHEVQGLWLQPAPNTPVVVKHGSTTLTVTSTSHNRVQFTVPVGAAATSGPITVQTGGGTATSPRIAYFAPPPSGLSLHRLGESGTYGPFTDGILHPGGSYRVVGSNIHFIPAGAEGSTGSTVAPVVQGAPGGAYVSSMQNGYTPFTLPQSQPLGALTLTYRHWGGSATVGSYQVVAKPVLAAVDQLQVTTGQGVQWWSYLSGVQGSDASRTIQSGTSMALVVRVRALTSGLLPPLTVTSSDPAMSVGGPYAFTPTSVVVSGTTNPPTATVNFTVQLQPLAATRTATLQFRVGNSQGAVGSVPVTLAPVSLPGLASVAFEPTEMTGGTHAKARIVLSSAPPLTMSLPVTTKDPVQVPSTVPLSAKETVFEVPTPVVTQATPVTVTVGSGADAKSASLTLYPVMRVLSLVPKLSPIPSGSVTDGVVTLNAPAWAAMTVTLTSGNPALLAMPSSVTFQKGQSVASIPLTSAAGATTVISVNVSAKIGQQTHTATIRVGPATP